MTCIGAILPYRFGIGSLWAALELSGDSAVKSTSWLSVKNLRQLWP